jgi:hypothetical protein
VTTPLAEEIQNAIGEDLRLRGFVMVEAPVVSKAFGDELVIFDSTSLRARMVRDRGDVFIDVASQNQPDRWWDLDLVGQVLRLKDPAGAAETQPARVQRLGRILREEFGALERAFSEEHVSETADALDQAAEVRARRFLHVDDENESVN